jgi:secreted PhoX family phosphatase
MRKIMKPNKTALAVISVLNLGLFSQVATAAKVEFLAMDPPATSAEKADIYTKAKIKYTYGNGTSRTFDLNYHQLMATTEQVNGKVVGGLFDSTDSPLTDLDGQIASDAPDGVSLMRIPGMVSSDPEMYNPLAMVTHFEYKELPPNDGVSTGDFWSKLPAAMGLARLEQHWRTGALNVVDYDNISFSGVKGGWIHCGSTLSAWNTHIGSEEYEPDAKTREGLPKASGSDDGTDINSFSKYYFGNPATANPYHYGLLPEVKVDKDGKAEVVKHYAPGRFAREMQEMANDRRTAIGGDDGKYTGLFMFVADRAAKLSAGTIYAAKVTQTSADNGGSFDLQWIRLGHATDAEIKKLVDSGIKFSDIFDVSNEDPNNASYKKVVTYTGTEWLRVKPGMHKAAAFLETRRYAALLGATTEFSKMEYIAFNAKDRKFYVIISRVEAGMADGAGDIAVARNDGGIILEMETRFGQKDSQGRAIKSNFVGTTLKSIPELVGGWNGGVKDAEGNQCEQDKLCGPDNLRYVDSIRTLFIGEDTSRRNNNYVWAFNIDTRKLSRILSVPMAAEATGLSIIPNYHGHAYIMSNFQHAGSGNISNYTGADKDAVLAAINAKWDNKKKAAIGYIGLSDGALPSLR